MALVIFTTTHILLLQNNTSMISLAQNTACIVFVLSWVYCRSRLYPATPHCSRRVMTVLVKMPAI
uniref:Uncharacterized protein n=1 Tax=mine drainage metagenome TaxID=410659 RepID=E6PYQ9_9ZZZZ